LEKIDFNIYTMIIYKTSKGYFYKEYKNGKKFRISKDKYLKHKKHKQIGGRIRNIPCLGDDFKLLTTSVKDVIVYEGNRQHPIEIVNKRGKPCKLISKRPRFKKNENGLLDGKNYNYNTDKAILSSEGEKILKNLASKIFTKSIIHCHGRLLYEERFSIPSRIRLVTSTIGSHYNYAFIYNYINFLKSNPEIFVDRGNLAITKAGMNIQNKDRREESALLNSKHACGLEFNREYKSMIRLVARKADTQMYDVLLKFDNISNVRQTTYYNFGIYVLMNGEWKLYYPVNKSNEIILEKLTDSFQSCTLKQSKEPQHLEHDHPKIIIKLSKLLDLLNKKAEENNCKLEVYLLACLYSEEYYNNIKTMDRNALNRQREATISHNQMLQEIGRSEEKAGVTKENTRTLHFNKKFFNEGYFERPYSELPGKDKSELLPKFEILTESDWEERKSDTKFQNPYKTIHSRFGLGRYKRARDMTAEELKAITILGFSSKTWDSSKKYVSLPIAGSRALVKQHGDILPEELSENQLAAAETLGYFELGRYKYTKDMTAEESKAIAILGFSSNTWDSANTNVVAKIFNTPFEKLSENKRAAAKTLGYIPKDFLNESVGGGKNKKSCKIAKRKLTKKKKTPAAKKKKRVRKIHKGPSGGRYYITKGRKVYL
jgi:hypothetical protein